jgi:hypothetical protein
MVRGGFQKKSVDAGSVFGLPVEFQGTDGVTGLFKIAGSLKIVLSDPGRAEGVVFLPL